MMPSARVRDFIGRAAMTSYFTFGATLKGMSILAMFSQEQVSAAWALDVVASIASFGFLLLIVLTTVTRLPPKNSADGIEPRLSALIGCFAMVLLIALPRVDISEPLRAAANTLTLVGSALCMWCLSWLGRSFSTMAQARRLVTAGPYALARHPLYVCEAVVLAGIILRNPMWQTFVLAAIGLSFQYRRILNEERVLGATFPEYAAYAKRVPMLGASWSLLLARQPRIG
jgi:protein-S-isoprenylcysteine O-methyltransferase Ste14